ncbi:hypothetical protein ACIRO3_05320 [Streptomyces sp. NPDC102278]|uniref:hypothetical protein n=1 Tax=Streptomyces sp. NPDC102278 TaxID=3366152 RepID=UPI0038017283
MVGAIGSGRLTDRVDSCRLPAAYFALRGVLLLLLPLIRAATVNATMMVFVVALGILDLATVPPVVALCRSFHGEDSAIVFGWINTAHQIGAALAALLGGVVRDAFGS